VSKDTSTGAQPQLKAEAKRIAAFNARFGTSAADLAIATSCGPEANERIKPPDSELYRLPHHWSKTATKTEFDGISRLLEQLKSLNEEFVGERTIEVEVYLAVTNRVRPFTEELQHWCAGYFTRRLARVNGKDQLNPALQYERLIREFNDAIARLSILPDSLNYVFLNECVLFVQWFLFVWRNFAPQPYSFDRVPLRLSGVGPFPECEKGFLLYQLGLWGDHLTSFVSHFAGAQTLSGPILQDTGSSPVSLLKEMASEIREIRPFLVHNFDTQKSVQQISGTDHFAAWSWCTQFGAAHIFSGNTQDEVIEDIATYTSRCPVVIDEEGILRDGRKPWISSLNETRHPELSYLGVNLVVLDSFHRTLQSFFAKVDLDRVRWFAGNSDTELSDDDQDAAIALASHVLKERAQVEESVESPVSPSLPRPVIRRLRLRTLLSILTRHFGCEIDHGKGSECTVYRPGGKKYTLGRHLANPEIATVVIKRLLKALRIPLNEWLSVLRD
jgi:hypothetical protein